MGRTPTAWPVRAQRLRRCAGRRDGSTGRGRGRSAPIERHPQLVDYGLAKVFQEETPEADSSMSPTLTRDVTRVGVILGTAAYMSPEQARGKPVDRRTDIWAFGAVLFEMLTGTKPFPGDDISQTLARVIDREAGLECTARDRAAESSDLLATLPPERPTSASAGPSATCGLRWKERSRPPPLSKALSPSRSVGVPRWAWRPLPYCCSASPRASPEHVNNFGTLASCI